MVCPVGEMDPRWTILGWTYEGATQAVSNTQRPRAFQAGPEVPLHIRS